MREALERSEKTDSPGQKCRPDVTTPVHALPRARVTAGCDIFALYFSPSRFPHRALYDCVNIRVFFFSAAQSHAYSVPYSKYRAAAPDRARE